MSAKIDYRKCIGCKKCYDLCPEDIFSWDEEMQMPKVAYPEECWFCGVCWMMCPKRAIDVRLPASLW
jgi:adenylylsulfate reductase, subunit B